MADAVGKHQEIVSIDTLGDLSDGQARATVNAAINAAIRDVEDRGADGKPRKVTVEVEFRRVGSGDRIDVVVKAKPTLPPYVTDPTVSAVKIDDRGKVTLAFSPADGDNPDQPPIDGTV